MSGTLGQPLEFLIFFIAGLIGAVFYALFWVTRRFVKPNGFFEAVLDFVCVLIAGLVFLFCMSYLADGSFKFFYVLAYLSAMALTLFVLKKTNALFDKLLQRLKKAVDKVIKKKRAKAASCNEALHRFRQF